jgi:glutamate-ammonia-ligase adenylyltransferase
MVQEAHAHSVPEGNEQERALARRLGYTQKNGQSERQLFWQDFRRHTRNVRQAFDRLFYEAQKDMQRAGTSGPGEYWKGLDQEEVMLSDLTRLGFSDPRRAYENLLAVRDGEPYSPPSARRHQVMRILGPALLSEITGSASPDQALFNLAQFSHQVGARTGFLSLLAENPATLRLLINLFANSQFLSDLFLKRPELIDSLIRVDLTELKKTKQRMTEELTSLLKQSEDLEEKLDTIRRYRAEEFLRIGLHDLGGALKLEEVVVQLSDLAGACLEGAFLLSSGEMEESFGRITGAAFAVLGMGKLGGREIDYNSDLDLIFIYEAAEDARSEGGTSGRLPVHDYYVRLGQKLITFLSVPTAEGVAYKIDMRLRPSGRSGPLVSSLEAFRHYHQTSSLLWERQALIKARCVAGDRGLGAKAEAIAEDFAYGEGLPPEGVAEIHHLRMRMEKELAQEDQSQFNLKKGKGGMVDIEFLTQMLQLAHGHLDPSLRKRGTLEALTALKDKRVLKRNTYRLLSQGYLFLRLLDHRLRLERDQSIDILEREGERLDGIAQALGYKSRGKNGAGAQLLREYETRRERIRACYDDFF